jgi:hypothetical protein
VDNETLKLIARVKIASTRAGAPIDAVKFAADRGYARAALARFTELADEEGTLLALQLLDRLKMTASPEAAAAPVIVPARNTQAPASPPARPATRDTQYVGRLR